MGSERTEGTLFQLPREVRDKIYSHCFGKSYRVFWSFYHDEFDSIESYADFAILRTSKALSSDAKSVLFRRSVSQAITFRYNIAFRYPEFSTPPVKEITDRMMNVELYVSLSQKEDSYLGGDWYPDIVMDPICEATVDHFASTAIVRDKMLIRLAVTGLDGYENIVVFIKTRFFQTLKNLKGFQKLTILLNIWTWYEDKETREDQKGVQEVSAELEPRLGPCQIRDEERNFIKDLNRSYAVELSFQPQKYYIESLLTEATNPDKEDPQA